MDLWIRSQDRKRLIPNPSLYAVESEAGVSYIGDTNEGHIGKYQTITRALEVLDEISKILKPQKIINTFNIEKADMLNGSQYRIIEKGISDFSIIQYNTYVYEMPLE